MGLETVTLTHPFPSPAICHRWSSWNKSLISALFSLVQALARHVIFEWNLCHWIDFGCPQQVRGKPGRLETEGTRTTPHTWFA